MSTALDHYKKAEVLLAKAAASRGGEGHARNLLLAASAHATLAQVGVTALASYESLPSHDRIAWMHTAGHYGPDHAPRPRRLAVVTEDERCRSCGHVPEDECGCTCCPETEEKDDAAAADPGAAGHGDGDGAGGAVAADRDD